ncbi:ATP synthase F1 subunit epsilon [Butyrivibrio sp. NC3005]|jgi:F-type H+-transporting ATPase subunit epsilon|uniref:ATP synthase F1 subunit epsilon n=1 Tax=Butyrivibrio sp. NC3005 TaxID=1280685 RepID=UPI00040D016B|nr:ATP synthase F1 subunit epsilon [Butyrivibrio sp. NC3005]
MAAPFHLQIATPDGGVFDGQATRLICRTIDGDVCVMARHTNYCSALGMGEARVTMEDGNVRLAACMGGMLNVMDGECRLVATTWEWKEDIDLDRAEDAKRRAEEMLAERDRMDDRDIQVAEAKLRRALIRSGVAKL